MVWTTTITALLWVVATQGHGAVGGDGAVGSTGQEPSGDASEPGVLPSRGPRQGGRQRVQVVRLCPPHGRLVRVGLVRPYVVRMENSWGRLGRVCQRVGAAAPGSAAVQDLVFLDGCAQDFQQVARVLEGERDPRWQGLAAALGARGDVVEGLLRSHVH